MYIKKSGWKMPEKGGGDHRGGTRSKVRNSKPAIFAMAEGVVL
jgi:hypothetical protein